jgi:hypothetical protein
MQDDILNPPRPSFESRHPVAHALCEAAGAVCLSFLLFAFCWLCCAASGYHWE